VLKDSIDELGLGTEGMLQEKSVQLHGGRVDVREVPARVQQPRHLREPLSSRESRRCIGEKEQKYSRCNLQRIAYV
jgi:hypothetical protein